MRQTNVFPLFNRIVVIVMGAGLTVGCVVAMAMKSSSGQLEVVEGVLLSVFAVLGAGVLYLGLTFRNRTEAELAEENAVASFDQPDISPEATVFHFAMLNKAAAIYLDHEAGAVHFRNCHVPRRFLASADEWFSCSISDLKGAHVFRHRGESLTIVTAEGKCCVAETGSDYVPMRDAIQNLVPKTQPGFSSDHPLMGMVYLGGCLAGLFGGVMLTPKNAPDSTLGLFVLGGSILGTVASHLLVQAGDRFKVSLAEPIGFGIVGAVAGTFVTRMFGPMIGWNFTPMIVLVSCGFCAGVCFGIWKQRQRAA